MARLSTTSPSFSGWWATSGLCSRIPAGLSSRPPTATRASGCSGAFSPHTSKETEMTARHLTGALFVAVPVVLVAGFSGLGMVFDYPAILRHPAGEVLTRFAAAGWDMHLYWYAMFLAAVALIPAAVGWALMNYR